MHGSILAAKVKNFSLEYLTTWSRSFFYFLDLSLALWVSSSIFYIYILFSFSHSSSFWISEPFSTTEELTPSLIVRQTFTGWASRTWKWISSINFGSQLSPASEKEWARLSSIRRHQREVRNATQGMQWKQQQHLSVAAGQTLGRIVRVYSTEVYTTYILFIVRY